MFYIKDCTRPSNYWRKTYNVFNNGVKIGFITCPKGFSRGESVFAFINGSVFGRFAKLLEAEIEIKKSLGIK